MAAAIHKLSFDFTVNLLEVAPVGVASVELTCELLVHVIAPE
jgi:hypothetical protein